MSEVEASLGRIKPEIAAIPYDSSVVLVFVAIGG